VLDITQTVLELVTAAAVELVVVVVVVVKVKVSPRQAEVAQGVSVG
jgi:hypothetical protein